MTRVQQADESPAELIPGPHPPPPPLLLIYDSSEFVPLLIVGLESKVRTIKSGAISYWNSPLPPSPLIFIPWFVSFVPANFGSREVFAYPPNLYDTLFALKQKVRLLLPSTVPTHPLGRHSPPPSP